MYFENMTTTDHMFLFFWAETLKNEVCIGRYKYCAALLSSSLPHTHTDFLAPF
jgi:hypothetical protein